MLLYGHTGGFPGFPVGCSITVHTRRLLCIHTGVTVTGRGL